MSLHVCVAWANCIAILMSSAFSVVECVGDDLLAGVGRYGVHDAEFVLSRVCVYGGVCRLKLC